MSDRRNEDEDAAPLGDKAAVEVPVPPFTGFRRRFWQPPRAHGDVIADRTVSFLELFYDLVYVVVIARASFALASDVTWQGVGEFAVVFSMIWLAWLNGTLYHDLHAREEGRTRVFVFLQMLLLALLAVYTAGAAGRTGQQFAVVYTLFLIVLTWLWYSVRRLDGPEYGPITARYLAAMFVSVALIGTSAVLPPGPRMVVWAVFVLAWLGFGLLMGRSTTSADGLDEASDSLVERFGLFIIIVLGEVVVGAVTGLSDSTLGPIAVLTGLGGLMIGFGIWWTYFDFVGRRGPRPQRAWRMCWMLGHLPVGMAITASGAALVSLIQHAGDARTPAPTGWLLSGAVAVGLAGLIGLVATLDDRSRFRSIYDPLQFTLAAAAVCSLAVAWWGPIPWLFVLSLVFLLGVVWLVAVERWLQLADPESALPRRH